MKRADIPAMQMFQNDGQGRWYGVIKSQASAMDFLLIVQVLNLICNAGPFRPCLYLSRLEFDRLDRGFVRMQGAKYGERIELRAKSGHQKRVQ